MRPLNFPSSETFLTGISIFFFPNFMSIAKIFIFTKTTPTMDLNVILSPWTLFFVALIVIIVMIIFLTLLERKLRKRVSLKREEQLIFQKKLSSLKEQGRNPRDLLVSVDALARDFFSQHYKVDRNAKYSELAKEFRKKGNIAASQFCEKIQETLYAGDSPTSERMSFLVSNLEFLINEQSKVSKLEKVQAKMADVKILSKPKDFAPDKRVISYLAEGVRRGFKIDLLRDKLFSAGFTKQEVEAAENYLNLNRKEPESYEIKSYPANQKEEDSLSPVAQAIQNDSEFIKSLDNLERIKSKISDKNDEIGAKKITNRTGLV